MVDKFPDNESKRDPDDDVAEREYEVLEVAASPEGNPSDSVNFSGLGDTGGEMASYSGAATPSLELVVKCDAGVAEGAAVKLKLRAVFGVSILGEGTAPSPPCLAKEGIFGLTCAGVGAPLGGVGVTSLS